jgi:diacylglycerol kinase family enzyme
VQQAVEILTKNGHSVTVAPTTGPATAGAIARDYIARGADLILAAGGDGTINEVAEGMVNSSVPLGILPAGTANVLAMEMRMGANLLRAAERLEGSVPRRISVGHLSCDGGKVSRYFLLMAGVGLDAHVVYHVSGALKAKTGKFAYWVAGWSLLGRRLVQMELEIDGRTRTCSFALLSKVRNYGGDFEIARDVKLFDDKFEAVVFEGRSSLPYVKYFAGMAINRLAGMSGVTVLRTDRARLTAPQGSRAYVQVDGEFAGHLPAEVRVVPDALTLLVPPSYNKMS